MNEFYVLLETTMSHELQLTLEMSMIILTCSCLENIKFILIFSLYVISSYIHYNNSTHLIAEMLFAPLFEVGNFRVNYSYVVPYRDNLFKISFRLQFPENAILNLSNIYFFF